MSVSIHKIENNLIPALKIFFKSSYEFEDDLNKLHTLLLTNKLSDKDKDFYSEIKRLGINDRDSVFIRDFHSYVDSCSNFNEEYLYFLKSNIVSFFPEEEKLVIQKTPNLRISFPNLTAIGKKENDNCNSDSIIGLHCDSDFGHHSSEINFVVPITEMFDTNSIYYEPSVGSNLLVEDYENLKLNTNEICKAYFNKLKHYNKLNSTGVTRISFDFRVIPYSKYQENLDYFKGTKFELGSYYVVL